MPALVYSLCVATSALCAALLLNAYLRSRTRLFLWTAIAFVLLAVNNAFVLGDMILFPEIDLLPYRYVAALAAVCVLVYGFIWEVE